VGHLLAQVRAPHQTSAGFREEMRGVENARESVMKLQTQYKRYDCDQ